MSRVSKKQDEVFQLDHFKCIIHERLLREKLRLSRAKLERFLHQCSTLDTLSFKKVKDEYHFYAPKLLEIMDRDSKKARPERGHVAPKIKIEDKEEDKYKEEEQNQNVLELASYSELEEIYFQHAKQTNKEGIDLLLEMKFKKADLPKLLQATLVYKKYVRKTAIEKSFIKGFKTFIETWEQWLDEHAGFCVDTSQPVSSWSGISEIIP